MHEAPAMRALLALALAVADCDVQCDAGHTCNTGGLAKGGKLYDCKAQCQHGALQS